MDARFDQSAPARWSGWLSVASFALSLVVLLGASTSLTVIVRPSAPYIGAAMDSYDSHILSDAERAVLDGVAEQAGWIWLAGTVLGMVAIVLAIAGLVAGRTVGADPKRPRISAFAIIAIVLMVGAPLVCALISGGLLMAASTPNT